MIYIDNRALDPFYHFGLEYYLISEKRFEQPVFMLWRNEPALMVGKYQNTLEEINDTVARRLGVQVVRRMSGGGTIYTDMGGWQFTFITPGKADQIDFAAYIVPVVGGLRALGLKAEFNGRNDLLVEGKKVSGNAQYMHAGYTLHHGSLLFDTDIEQLVKCTTVDNQKIVSLADDMLFLPRTEPIFCPVVEIVPLQMLAYHVAKENGCDIDKPKNLAKSVTVE